MEYERAQKKAQKQQNAQEAVSTLNHLSDQKKREWDSVHKNDENKRKTLALAQEQEKLKREHIGLMKQQKEGYKNNLQYQMQEHTQQTRAERDEDIRKEKLSNGFEFECYTRDQLIAREKRNTTDFLKNQQNLNKEVRVVENHMVRAAPPNLVTVNDVNKMQEEAKQQMNHHKRELNQVMRSQYHGSINQKQAERAEEKARAEAEMRAQAAQNRQIEQIEASQRKAQKEDLRSHLKNQMNEKQTVAQQEWQREHDPSAHHNLRRVTKVLACEECDAVVGKQGYLEEMSDH